MKNDDDVFLILKINRGSQVAYFRMNSLNVNDACSSSFPVYWTCRKIWWSFLWSFFFYWGIWWSFFLYEVFSIIGKFDEVFSFVMKSFFLYEVAFVLKICLSLDFSYFWFSSHFLIEDTSIYRRIWILNSRISVV